MHPPFILSLLAATAYAQTCPPTCGTQGRYSAPTEIAKLEADDLSTCREACAENQQCQSFGFNQAKVCRLYSSPLSEQGKHIKKRRNGNELNRLVYYDENCFEPSCDESCSPTQNRYFAEYTNNYLAPPWVIKGSNGGGPFYHTNQDTNNREVILAVQGNGGDVPSATISQKINDLVIGYPYTLYAYGDSRLDFYPNSGSCTLTAYLGDESGLAYSISGTTETESNLQFSVAFKPTARSMKLSLEYQCPCTAPTTCSGDVSISQITLQRSDLACQK